MSAIEREKIYTFGCVLVSQSCVVSLRDVKYEEARGVGEISDFDVWRARTYALAVENDKLGRLKVYMVEWGVTTYESLTSQPACSRVYVSVTY